MLYRFFISGVTSVSPFVRVFVYLLGCIGIHCCNGPDAPKMFVKVSNQKQVDVAENRRKELVEALTDHEKRLKQLQHSKQLEAKEIESLETLLKEVRRSWMGLAGWFRYVHEKCSYLDTTCLKNSLAIYNGYLVGLHNILVDSCNSLVDGHKRINHGLADETYVGVLDRHYVGRLDLHLRALSKIKEQNVSKEDKKRIYSIIINDIVKINNKLLGAIKEPKWVDVKR